MVLAEIKNGILNDIVFVGLRSVLGVIFIVHGIPKFGAGFAGALPNMGLPAEIQFPIALAEVIPGILLISGVFSRLSAAVISAIMVGAIFYLKGAQSLTGDGGIEFDLILLAAALTVMIAGPGKASIAHIVKRLPRCLH